MKRPTGLALGGNWNLDGPAQDGRGPTTDFGPIDGQGPSPTRDRRFG
ncbi:MAG TPA: hypothetical protein VIK41_26675 [Gemmatimonadaceae bacterium]